MTGPKVFVAALLFYVGTAGGSLGTTDAVVTFDLTKRLVEDRSIALSGNLLGFDSMRGADGRYYSPFGIAQSVWNVPFYLAGRAAARGLGLRLGSPDTVPKAAVALGGAVAAALGVWATFAFASRLYGGRSSAGLLAAAVLCVGTAWWPYSKFGFNQPLAGLFVVTTLDAAWRGARHGGAAAWRLAGAGWAGALLTRHELGLLLLPMAVFCLLEFGRDRVRWGQALRGLAPGVIGGVLAWATYNAARFHNPLDTGLLRDPTPAMGSSITTGLHGLLLSPQASLFLYSPAAILGVLAMGRWWARDRATAWLLGGTTLVFVVFYAQLGNWLGGRSYGGRYLVTVLPLLSVAAIELLTTPRRLARGLAIALCAVSVLVQLPGVAVDFAKVRVASAQAAGAAGVGPPNSLVLNTRAMVLDVPRNVRYVLGLEAPPEVDTTASAEDRTFSQRFSFSLDVWWLYLFHMRVVPAPVAIALGIGTITSAVAMAILAWGAARGAPL